MNVQKRRRRATRKIQRLMWRQLVRKWLHLVRKAWGPPLDPVGFAVRVVNDGE